MRSSVLPRQRRQRSGRERRQGAARVQRRRCRGRVGSRVEVLDGKACAGQHRGRRVVQCQAVTNKQWSGGDLSVQTPAFVVTLPSPALAPGGRSLSTPTSGTGRDCRRNGSPSCPAPSPGSSSSAAPEGAASTGAPCCSCRSLLLRWPCVAAAAGRLLPLASVPRIMGGRSCRKKGSGRGACTRRGSQLGFAPRQVAACCWAAGAAAAAPAAASSECCGGLRALPDVAE